MKLNEIFKKDLSQNDMKSFYNNLKGEEIDYTKKPVKLLYRIADKNEKIVTMTDGEKETENIAKPGDWILTGVKGEKYVLSEKKVKDRYDILDKTTIQAKPSKIKAKLYDGEKMKFIASWGETMLLKSGDYLVDNNDEFYRIEGNIFKETYARSK